VVKIRLRQRQKAVPDKRKAPSALAGDRSFLLNNLLEAGPLSVSRPIEKVNSFAQCGVRPRLGFFVP